MQETIQFRDARLEDLPAIVAIYNSTIPSRMVTADTDPVTVVQRTAWFHEHHPSGRPLWVIEYERRICGWVSLQSFYGRPAYRGTAEVSVYVHEDYRGRGIGHKALIQVMEECPRLEVDTLLGFIFAHNEPSIRLFTGLGFERWAHLPEVAVLDGIRRDLIILGRKIH